MHVSDANVLALPDKMNPADVDALGPHIVAPDDRSAPESQVRDILADEELPVRSAVVAEEKGGSIHPQCEVGIDAYPRLVSNTIDHRCKDDFAAGQGHRIDGLLNLRLVTD